MGFSRQPTEWVAISFSVHKAKYLSDSEKGGRHFCVSVCPSDPLLVRGNWDEKTSSGLSTGKSARLEHTVLFCRETEKVPLKKGPKQRILQDKRKGSLSVKTWREIISLKINFSGRRDILADIFLVVSKDVGRTNHNQIQSQGAIWRKQIGMK